MIDFAENPLYTSISVVNHPVNFGRIWKVAANLPKQKQKNMKRAHVKRDVTYKRKRHHFLTPQCLIMNEEVDLM